MYNMEPSQQELAEALRKKRAQQVAEQKFNQPSAFTGISVGELEAMMEDVENTPTPEEPVVPLTREEQIDVSSHFFRSDIRTDKEIAADKKAAVQKKRVSELSGE
jgi:hypothetical protein